jgi:hypothetical protein
MAPRIPRSSTATKVAQPSVLFFRRISHERFLTVNIPPGTLRGWPGGCEHNLRLGFGATHAPGKRRYPRPKVTKRSLRFNRMEMAPR